MITLRFINESPLIYYSYIFVFTVLISVLPSRKIWNSREHKADVNDHLILHTGSPFLHAQYFI